MIFQVLVLTRITINNKNIEGKYGIEIEYTPTGKL
jgi:hypothetical protein